MQAKQTATLITDAAVRAIVSVWGEDDAGRDGLVDLLCLEAGVALPHQVRSSREAWEEQVAIMVQMCARHVGQHQGASNRDPMGRLLLALVWLEVDGANELSQSWRRHNQEIAMVFQQRVRVALRNSRTWVRHEIARALNRPSEQPGWQMPASPFPGTQDELVGYLEWNLDWATMLANQPWPWQWRAALGRAQCVQFELQSLAGAPVVFQVLGRETDELRQKIIGRIRGERSDGHVVHKYEDKVPKSWLDVHRRSLVAERKRLARPAGLLFAIVLILLFVWSAVNSNPESFAIPAQPVTSEMMEEYVVRFLPKVPSEESPPVLQDAESDDGLPDIEVIDKRMALARALPEEDTVDQLNVPLADRDAGGAKPDEMQPPKDTEAVSASEDDEDRLNFEEESVDDPSHVDPPMLVDKVAEGGEKLHKAQGSEAGSHAKRSDNQGSETQLSSGAVGTPDTASPDGYADANIGGFVDLSSGLIGDGVQKTEADYFGTERVKSLPDSAPMEFVRLPAGSFMMGSSYADDERFLEEEPWHRVDLSAFWISRTEVSQAQWRVVMDTRSRSHFVGDALPVESVNWCDALRFANRLSEMENRTKAYRIPHDCKRGGTVVWEQSADGYRLPTEAEWEYAGRAGSNKRYSGSHAETSLLRYAWVRMNSASQTHAVGSKKPNRWGLYDIHGNVFEWVWGVLEPYDGRPGGDPAPLALQYGARHVFRGGSWNSPPRESRIAYRAWYEPGRQDPDIGFRLVRSDR